ncbi:HPP family protein [Halobacteriales archaeon QS_3_64_16]|nr:MAG: HPP family protein [Halobacteriales archaeon QS_3_64_16]
MDERIETSLHTGLLIAVVGSLAWATGLPMVFPSLGPSAFVLALFPDGEASNPRRVLGAHAIGVVAGLLAYQAFASGLVVTRSVPPFSATSLLLAASGVVSIVLTVAGMLSFDCSHPPACATTLIVALGLLSTVTGGAVIVASVAVLLAAQALFLSSIGRSAALGTSGSDENRL